MKVASKVVAWFWVLSGIVCFLSFMGKPTPALAVAAVVFLSASFALLSRRVVGWWTLLFLNGIFALLSIMMAFAQPIAGMIGLLLYGGAFIILLRDRPSQWSASTPEQEDAEEQEETSLPPVTAVQHAASPAPAPAQRKITASSTHQARPRPMVKCPSCGYPNRHGRTICFKCQTPLPTPTPIQRLGSWVLSWNALCFALIVVVALFIHAMIVSRGSTAETPLNMGSTTQAPVQQQPQSQSEQQQPVQAQEPDQSATLSDSQARDGLMTYASKMLPGWCATPSLGYCEFDEITSISVSACDRASGYDYSGRVGYTMTEEKPDDPKNPLGPQHQEVYKKHADWLRHKVGAPADQWEGLEIPSQ